MNSTELLDALETKLDEAYALYKKSRDESPLPYLDGVALHIEDALELVQASRERAEELAGRDEPPPLSR